MERMKTEKKGRKTENEREREMEENIFCVKLL